MSPFYLSLALRGRRGGSLPPQVSDSTAAARSVYKYLPHGVQREDVPERKHYALDVPGVTEQVGTPPLADELFFRCVLTPLCLA